MKKSSTRSAKKNGKRPPAPKPVGRPKLAVPRDKVLYLRFSAEEQIKISDWAAKCNRSAPDWARLILLRCVDAEVRE